MLEQNVYVWWAERSDAVLLIIPLDECCVQMNAVLGQSDKRGDDDAVLWGLVWYTAPLLLLMVMMIHVIGPNKQSEAMRRYIMMLVKCKS